MCFSHNSPSLIPFTQLRSGELRPPHDVGWPMAEAGLMPQRWTAWERKVRLHRDGRSDSPKAMSRVDDSSTRVSYDN